MLLPRKSCRFAAEGLCVFIWLALSPQPVVAGDPHDFGFDVETRVFTRDFFLGLRRRCGPETLFFIQQPRLLRSPARALLVIRRVKALLIVFFAWSVRGFCRLVAALGDPPRGHLV